MGCRHEARRPSYAGGCDGVQCSKRKTVASEAECDICLTVIENALQNLWQTVKTEKRILYANKNSQNNKSSPGVQFPDAILVSDYSNNLAQFKTAVKNRLANTLFKKVDYRR